MPSAESEDKSLTLLGLNDFLYRSESLTNLFEEKEEEIEVAPDTGAPVTEPPKKFGIKEKAFETLVEDEEEEKLEEQEEDEEIKQIVKSYSAGKIKDTE